MRLLTYIMRCHIIIMTSHSIILIFVNKGVKMSELKILKIGQTFDSPKDLYRYLIKNVEFISNSIGIQIQKPMKAKPFCIIGREKITERNILFYLIILF